MVESCSAGAVSPEQNVTERPRTLQTGHLTPRVTNTVSSDTVTDKHGTYTDLHGLRSRINAERFQMNRDLYRRAAGGRAARQLVAHPRNPCSNYLALKSTTARSPSSAIENSVALSATATS